MVPLRATRSSPVVRALVGLAWSYLHALQSLARHPDLLLLGWNVAWVCAFSFSILLYLFLFARANVFIFGFSDLRYYHH
jgi:hypothetical protein